MITVLPEFLAKSMLHMGIISVSDMELLEQGKTITISLYSEGGQHSCQVALSKKIPVNGNSERHYSTRQEKREWLRQHPELWNKSSQEIKKEMVAAHLVSPTTYHIDLGLKNLVAELKSS